MIYLLSGTAGALFMLACMRWAREPWKVYFAGLVAAGVLLAVLEYKLTGAWL